MDGKTVSDGIESQFEGLSLENYVLAREAYCAEYHQQPCQNCLGMLNIANTILKEGFWKMKGCVSLFGRTYTTMQCMSKENGTDGNEQGCKPMQRPDPVNMVNYTSFHARRKFLQMPIAALSIETNKNQLVIFLVAKGSNYKMLASVLRQIHASKLQRNNPLLTRNNFSTLLHLCQSDAER